MPTPSAKKLVTALALTAASLASVDGQAWAKEKADGVRAEPPVSRAPIDRVTRPAERLRFDRIVYIDAGKLFVSDPNGDNPRQLAGGLPHDANAWQPVWSPDGTQVAFVAQWFDQEHTKHRYELYTLDANGRNLRKQLAYDPSLYYGELRGVSWLDRHTLVVGYGKKHGFGQSVDWGLYTLALNSRNPQPLDGVANGNTAWPAVSPDGKSIAYEYRASTQHHWKVRVVDRDTGQDRPLTTSGYGEQRHPRWSPDGQRLTFHKKWGSDTQVYLIDADGTGQQQLTWPDPDDNALTPAEDSFDASWAPDGESLLMVRRVDGYGGLVELDLVSGETIAFEVQDSHIKTPSFNPRYAGPVVQTSERPQRVERNRPQRPIEVNGRDRVVVPAEPAPRRRR
ncbi:MAG: hypothetical protein AAF288_06225 [Planctomycetota bacterium]